MTLIWYTDEEKSGELSLMFVTLTMTVAVPLLLRIALSTTLI